MENNSEKQLNILVSRGILFVTLFIEPWLLISPANLEHTFLLHIFNFGLISVLFLQRFHQFIYVKKVKFLFLFLFLLWALIVIIRSEISISQQIFGTFGRNTGFAFYLQLVILLIILSSLRSKKLIFESIKVMCIAGLVTALYGSLQKMKLDPFEFDTAGQAVGFFGNTNFQSSFLGISSIGFCAFLILQKNTFKHKFSLVIAILFSLFNIYLTDSVQGFLVFIIGVWVIGFFWVYASESRLFLGIYSALGGLGGFFAVLLLFGFGPSARIINIKTIEIRGFYWQSGLEMIRSQPFFGLGFDSYGEYYREFRGAESIVEFGPGLVTNAAHNVFIDMGVSGGLPLLVGYLSVVIYTFIVCIRFFRRSTTLNVYFIALFACWVGYLSQLFVSINQVNLAIWGWVLMGLLIGFEHTTRQDPDTQTSILRRANAQEFGFDPVVSLRFLIGAMVGLLIGLPPYQAEVRFRSALQSQSAVKIEKAAMNWPRNSVYMIKAAEVFRDNELQEMALKMTKNVVQEFPYSVVGWKILLTLENLDPILELQARTNLEKLDPLDSQKR